MSELKVSDLVNFRVEDHELGKVTIDSLSKIAKEYSIMRGNINPIALDELKREFMGHMFVLTEVYSKVKAFKSSNHSYLEDARKKYKAEAFIMLRKEGKNVTEADKVVYAHPYFVERQDLMEKMRQFFIKIEELHQYFSTVLQLIQQTVSIVSKEWEANRVTK